MSSSTILHVQQFTAPIIPTPSTTCQHFCTCPCQVSSLIANPESITSGWTKLRVCSEPSRRTETALGKRWNLLEPDHEVPYWFPSVVVWNANLKPRERCMGLKANFAVRRQIVPVFDGRSEGFDCVSWMQALEHISQIIWGTPARAGLSFLPVE